MLWIVLAALTAAVVYGLSQPLMRADDGASPDAAADSAVYKDQLAEIDADRARGLIGNDEAEAARAEVARRLLQHSEAMSNTTVKAPQEKSWSGFERGLLIVPLGAMALYVWLGSPHIPSQPLATRAPPPAANAGIDDLIKRVETQLKTTPDDGRGWEVIAPIYLKIKRYDSAAYAFSQSIRLNGETPERLMGFAEADMLGNQGIVSDAVKSAAQRIIMIDPKRIEPKIWLALGKEQGGDVAGAITDYKVLLAAATPDAPWREALENQIKKLKHMAVGDAATPQSPPVPATPVPAETTPPASSSADRPPAPASPEDIARMAPAEQQKMIAGMVDKLAARLKENANDLGGWQRLIRAYQVMGRTDDVIVALATARKQFANDTSALTEINGLAASLGLN